jgi:hypothetical protein
MASEERREQRNADDKRNHIDWECAASRKEELELKGGEE